MNGDIGWDEVAAFMGRIETRVKNGTMSPASVYEALRSAVDGVGRFAQLAWYRSPELQLDRLRWLNEECDLGFEDSDFPAVPTDDSVLRYDEVFLLALYLPTFEGYDGLGQTACWLWESMPNTGAYWRNPRGNMCLTPEYLRQAPEREYRPGIRWVAYDPFSYSNSSWQRATRLAKDDGVTLAGIEVLMAFILFPELSASDQLDRRTFLGGLQARTNVNGEWDAVPCFARYDLEGLRMAHLLAPPAMSSEVTGTWPSYREL